MTNGFCAAAGQRHAPQMPADGQLIRRISDLERLVDGLMVEWVGNRAPLYGRRSHRVPTRQFFDVTPLCDCGVESVGDSYRVQAFDLSTDGLSFVHSEMLPFRFVAATFELADSTLQTVVTRLKWCRFTRKKQYRSGGQFLRVLEPDWEGPTPANGLSTG